MEQTVTLTLTATTTEEMEYWASIIDRQVYIARDALNAQKKRALERVDRQDIDDVYITVEWSRVFKDE